MLIAIQFIVINHGAVRISEVTARFTLDAMPGRQMAIDADLNAGVIDEKEARDRRERVRREADFYGAMDGAIRFTQRDALAAVLITGVNIVAGLIIGVFQHGLDLATAAETYTILTVGEGLVTAIPALLVSMAGGLITTRAAAESNLGEEVAAQLLARSRPLLRRRRRAAAAGAIPGLPKLSFLHRRGAARRRGLRRARHRGAGGRARRRRSAAGAADAGEAPTVGVEPLSVEVGYALVGLVDEKQGGTLLTRVRAIRRQIATETGVVVPPVRIADNLQLGPRGYTHPGQGRRGRARRALRRSPAGHQPGHRVAHARRRADARAGVRPAGAVGRPASSATPRPPPATPWSMRRPRSRRTCRRRSARSCRIS